VNVILSKLVATHEYCVDTAHRLNYASLRIIVFLILVFEAIGTAATPGLLCQPWVIVKMIEEKQMECRLAGETEVLGKEPAPAPLLSITKSHMTRPGCEPGPPRFTERYQFELFNETADMVTATTQQEHTAKPHTKQ
jgi:hypothetical protein